MTFLRRRRASRPPAPAARPDRQQALAVLTAARAVVARGWVRGAWYVLEGPDGARRVVGAGSMARRDQGAVVQACRLDRAVARLSPEPTPQACHQSCTVPSASRLNGR